ncbi:MAG: hypothetical protein AB8H79_14165 [Myxococcota bacterium]
MPTLDAHNLRLGAVSLDGIGVVKVTGDSRLTFCNPEAGILLGANSDDCVGQSLAVFFQQAGRQWIRNAMARGGLGIEERPALTSAGVAVRLWPVRPGEYLVLEDSAHAALDDEREAHQCDGARSELAAAVARDLNDPMSIVQGRLELLLEMDPDADSATRRHLQIALDHARRISGTLHMLRLVGGPKTGSGTSVSARELLVDACHDIDGVALKIVLEPRDLRLYGPPDIVRQVLVGLVGRVRDAASRGLVACAVGREEAGHAIIELRAETEGGPMATPVPVSGDPRLDVGVFAQVFGRIGGRVEAYRLGRGVLYRLVLPQAPQWNRASKRVRGSAIVVGLDSPTDLCALMAQEGFDATCVQDGEGALQSLQTQNPDAIVASMHLPGMSGLTFMRHVVRTYPRLQGRAVLVCRRVPGGVPDGVAVCTMPLDRSAFMRGLGLAVSVSTH